MTEEHDGGYQGHEIERLSVYLWVESQSHDMSTAPPLKSRPAVLVS